MSDVLEQYDGNIAVRHLITKRTDAMLKSAIEWAFSSRENIQTESDIVKGFYEKMGLFEESETNVYVTTDFSSDAENPIAFSKGAQLGPEIYLK